MQTENDMPRRIQMDKWSPAECAIFTAMQEVEKVGAHPKLTDAVVLLSQAKDALADYVDEFGFVPESIKDPLEEIYCDNKTE